MGLLPPPGWSALDFVRENTKIESLSVLGLTANVVEEAERVNLTSLPTYKANKDTLADIKKRTTDDPRLGGYADTLLRLGQLQRALLAADEEVRSHERGLSYSEKQDHDEICDALRGLGSARVTKSEALFQTGDHEQAFTELAEAQKSLYAAITIAQEASPLRTVKRT